MLQQHLNPASVAQAFRQLLRQINGAVLSTGATERDHEAFDSATLIFIDARIHQRHNVREILMYALLLVQVVDHGSIPSSKCLETLFPSGVGQVAAVEYNPASMAALICRQAAMKREAGDAHGQVFR